MSTFRNVLGATSLGFALLTSVPSIASSSDHNGADRRDSSEILQATYAGPETAKPPSMPPTSYAMPVIRSQRAFRSHNNK